MKDQHAANGKQTMDHESLLEGGCLGITEAMQFSGLKRTYLYQLMGSGRLPYTTVGRRRLLPKKALQKLLAQGLVGV